jgi:hypothetical protein
MSGDISEPNTFTWWSAVRPLSASTLVGWGAVSQIKTSEFRNMPSFRSVLALGAHELRSVELLCSEYSALSI